MINPIKFWRSLAIVQGCILVAVIFVSFHYYSLFKGARYWLMDRACWTGDVHGVEILLSFGASPDGLSDYIDSADHHGVEFSSHLSQAAYEKHKEIVAILLKHGANPNVLEGEGWTAIKSAARANDIEVAKMLLSAGADPDAGKGYGSGTAVDVARTYKSNDVERLLEDYKNKNTANKAEERDTAR